MMAATDSAAPIGGWRPGDATGPATVLAATVLLLLTWWASLSTVLNHDSAWYLHAAGVILDGGRLYHDVVEINPPLAFFLAVPPVWLARLTGLFPVDLFYAWIYALTALSLALSWRALGLLPGLPDRVRQGLLLAAFLALVLCTWRQIGQREHFLVVFALPYLLLLAARSVNASARTGFAGAIGAFAAFGFALKPHFLLLPAAAEVYRMARSRQMAGLLRPETVVLAACIAAYGMAVVFLTPEYLTRFVPWGLDVYHVYGGPLLGILWRWETLLLLLILPICLRDRATPSVRPVRELFLLAAICAYAIYLVQFKGWTYHRFPVTACLLMALAASLLAELETVGSDLRRLLRPRPIILTLLFGWLALGLVTAGSYENRFFKRALPAIQSHGSGGSLHVFSSNVWQAFPLAIYARIPSSSRFSTLWLLPGVQQGIADAERIGDDARLSRLRVIEQYAIDAVIQDLEAHPPELVLVDTRAEKSYFGDVDFDYIAYFSRDPRFAAIWQDYRQIDTIGAFQLYRRTGRRGP